MVFSSLELFCLSIYLLFILQEGLLLKLLSLEVVYSGLLVPLLFLSRNECPAIFIVLKYSVFIVAICNI